jgi:hypothetical protein
MTNYFESDTYTDSQPEANPPVRWVKLGMIAIASAFACGLAAAWWYRSTLKKLHQADEQASNPHFGIPAEDES